MTWMRSDVSRPSSWTKAEIRRARQVVLRPVLEDLGYHFTELRNGNYLVHHLAAETCHDVATQGRRRIVVKDHYWVSKDNGSAGNAIDFMVQVQGMSFSQAVELLLSYCVTAKPQAKADAGDTCTTRMAERPEQNRSSGQRHRRKKALL